MEETGDKETGKNYHCVHHWLDPQMAKKTPRKTHKAIFEWAFYSLQRRIHYLHISYT